MVTVDGQDLVQAAEDGDVRQVKPKLQIHPVVAFWIHEEWTGDQRPSDEDSRLPDEVERPEARSCERWCPHHVEKLAGAVDEGGVAIDNPDLGVAFEDIHDMLDDVAREVGIVGVSQPMISPVDRTKALLMASDCPSSGVDSHTTTGEADARISTDPSVDPPSMTTCSMAGYDCAATERRLSASHRPWL